MKITSKPLNMIVIEDIMNDHHLDQIRVITENLSPGQGRIIIVCYNASWVGYWGAMSGKTIEQFFTSCDAQYLSCNMTSSSHLRKLKSDSSYLIRIIIAVQQAIRNHAS